ncbi:hypothetical protein GCM10022234_27800 [Aeromicrobium panaciterrae]|uniref:hypothetical protein n=1 Tax=Aeromicrobium panaciterrae TaxID=363861 RepID=UPI0031DADE05
MTVLAVLLASIGAADIIGRRVLPGFVVVIAGLLLVGAGWNILWLAPLLGIAVFVWIVAARSDSFAGITLLAVYAIVLIALSGTLTFDDVPIQGWFDDLAVPSLATVPFDRFALGIGVVLFLTSAANVVVREVLSLTGPRVLEQEDDLQGGRVLGPLERWFVFACAVTGNLPAIAIVVAAKGILRFPEISRDKPEGLRAEYVLIGSFVSWGLALAFVPLF